MSLAQGVLAGGLALAGLAAAWPLDAATSSSFQVSATVSTGCLVVGGGSNYGTLNFGSWSALATGTATAAVPGTGVTLQCTPGVTLNMKVDGGQNAGTSRNLKAGSALLAYQLYRDAAYSQSLGISQSVTVAYADSTNISLPIYGRLSLPGNLPAGSYSDVLQVELSW
ncbi:Csu type fimbrial protein [Pseudomonas sp. RIT-To-2]|uniref:Csu type fimbrial protein n=1 Tax=Pseudomonas sp. RIT-To-2 TaxID=3462541 RepID=UPI0024134D15